MDIYKIQKTVEEEFAMKKALAENVAENNHILASKNPAFLKLVGLEKELNLEIGKLEASSSDEKAIRNLKSTLNNLLQEKHKYLSSIGLKEEDLVPKYDCPICHDTGRVFGEPCKCFIRAKNKKIIEECALKLDEIPDFSELDESVIKNKDQKLGFDKLKDFLEKWCEGFPNVTKSKIVICGQTGVGKTTLAKCMAKRLFQKGHLVCFLTAYEMGNIMLKYHTSFGENKLDALSPLLESDVLFVDDLGIEPILKNVTLECLQLVLTERERQNRPIIFTTNLDETNIMERYGERIYSRLADKKTSIFYKLCGSDLRR